MYMDKPGSLVIECMITLMVSTLILVLGHRCVISMVKNRLHVSRQSDHMLEVSAALDLLFKDMHRPDVTDVSIPQTHMLKITTAGGDIIWKYENKKVVRKSTRSFELISAHISYAAFIQHAGYISCCIGTDTYTDSITLPTKLRAHDTIKL